MKKIILIKLIIFLLSGFIYGQGVTSLYSDIKAAQVGDVLTVIIIESANASRESKMEDKTSSGMSIKAGTSGNLADFLPAFGGSSDINSNYSGSDGTKQSDRLTGRITVRIEEISESGMIKIKGERKLGVNGKQNLLELEGYVRSKDITTDNTIFSYNIADAKITYRKDSLSDKFISTGTMTKVITWLVGGLMVAAGAGYFAFN